MIPSDAREILGDVLNKTKQNRLRWRLSGEDVVTVSFPRSSIRLLHGRRGRLKGKDDPKVLSVEFINDRGNIYLAFEAVEGNAEDYSLLEDLFDAAKQVTVTESLRDLREMLAAV